MTDNQPVDVEDVDDELDDGEDIDGVEYDGPDGEYGTAADAAVSLDEAAEDDETWGA